MSGDRSFEEMNGVQLSLVRSVTSASIIGRSASGFSVSLEPAARASLRPAAGSSFNKGEQPSKLLVDARASLLDRTLLFHATHPLILAHGELDVVEMSSPAITLGVRRVIAFSTTGSTRYRRR